MMMSQMTPFGPHGDRACAPDALVKLGVIVNVNARGHRAHGPGDVRELAALAAGSRVVATASRGEAEHALDDLVRSGVNVVAVSGGDGTLHHALHALRRDGRLFHGALLPLPSGTLNIVSRAVTNNARALLQRLRGVPFAATTRHGLDVLDVSHASIGTRSGFVFGSEMVKNALELYDRFGGGYMGLSRFLFEAGRGYVWNTELWKQESWRLVPPRSGVSVDGVHMPRYSAVVAATCELAVAGGAVRALSPSVGGFTTRVVTESRTGPLLKLIPTLMREGDAPGVREFRAASRIELEGAFTLDGETYGASSRDGAGGQRVSVTLGQPVQIVAGIGT